ncbi:MAG: S41 family peptidase [Peptococcia bacterium]
MEKLNSSISHRPMYLRRFGQIAGIFLIILALCFGLYKLFFDPHRGTIMYFTVSEKLDKTLSREEAIEDLDLMMHYLKERHPACLQNIPEEVITQYKSELSAMSEQPTVLELWRSASAILALMKDGHTYINHFSEDLSELPVSFTINQDDLYLSWSDNGPYRVIAIEGQALETLYADFIRRFSYEREIYARFQFARRLPRKGYLEFLGLDSSKGIEITCDTPTGQQKTAFALVQPENEISDEPFVSYEINPEYSLGILRLRSCIYNEEYRSTLRDFFSQVRDEDIQHIAVDLRGNGGGNSYVINEFLRYLNIDKYKIYGSMSARMGPCIMNSIDWSSSNKKYQDLLFEGKVYALTSINSFSSALDFAVVLQDYGLAKIIGESPGGMPSSYGDSLYFQLPNSKLGVSISYKYFERVDASKNELPLIPDYETSAATAEEKLISIIKG